MAVAGGAVAMMLVSLLTVNELAGVEPKVTAVTSANPVPVITMTVPPVIGPLAGLTAVTVGSAEAIVVVVESLPANLESQLVEVVTTSMETVPAAVGSTV